MASAAAAAKELAKIKHQRALSNARNRAQRDSMTSTFVRKGALLTAAGVYGALNRFEVGPSIGGFPYKVGVIGICWIGEALTSGVAQAIFGGIGDGSMAIYTERAISNNTLVAGAVGEDDEMEVIEAEGGEL